MIRVIHQRTSLCKNSLFSECLNLIKGKLKKKNLAYNKLLSFPISGSLVALQASFGSERSVCISTNLYHQSFTQQTSTGPGTGQALRFRHGCRSLPLGGLPGCSVSREGRSSRAATLSGSPRVCRSRQVSGEGQGIRAATLSGSPGVCRSRQVRGKDKASQADEAAHTDTAPPHIRGRCQR